METFEFGPIERAETLNVLKNKGNEYTIAQQMRNQTDQQVRAPRSPDKISIQAVGRQARRRMGGF